MENIIKKFSENKITVASCESCTGGLVASAFVDVPGSSDVFLEGAVTYSNEAKVRLGVSEDTLQEFGAVSEEVALQMAKAIKKRAGASVGISTTGIAGPGGGTDKKPVGLVYTAIVTGNGENVYKLNLTGSRTEVRNKTVEFIKERLKEL